MAAGKDLLGKPLATGKPRRKRRARSAPRPKSEEAEASSG
jgi:hypothetical protein